MRFPRLLIIVLLIVVPAVMRAVHFERSLVPMGALALFCGAHFRSRWLALAIPLASMLLGDVLIGLFHHNVGYAFHFVLPVVYACYAINVLMGIGLKRYWDGLKSLERRGGDAPAPSVLTTRVLPVAGTTLAGAFLFFLATNFPEWYLFDTYAKTWHGLLDCYVAGIPFFRRGTLLADIIGSALLFGGDYLLQMHTAEQMEAERI